MRSPSEGKESKVTPAEALTASLQAVEARRKSEEAASREIAALARTLELMEINAEPKDVWHELTARQVPVSEIDTQKAVHGLEDSRKRKLLRNTAIGIVSLALVALLVRVAINHFQDYQMAKGYQQGAKAGPAAAPYANFFRKTPTTKSLGDIAEGEVFRTDMQTLISLGNLLYPMHNAKPVPFSEAKDILIETHPPLEKAAWQMVCTGGKFYFRGWTSGVVAMQAPAPSGTQKWAVTSIYSSPEAVEQFKGFNGTASSGSNGAHGVRLGTTGSGRSDISTQVFAGSTNGVPVPAAPPPVSDAKLVQVTIPLGDLGGYSASESHGQGVISIVALHPKSYRYDSWKPMPLPSPAPLTATATRW